MTNSPHPSTDFDAMRSIEIHPDLLAAVEARDADAVARVIAAGVDVNARGRDGVTALHLAVTNPKSEKIVGMLLAAGARVSARTTSGETPLHWAVSIGSFASEATVRMLIAAGAGVNAVASEWATPLTYALNPWGAHDVGVLAVIRAAGAVECDTVEREEPCHAEPTPDGGVRYYRLPSP
jgi:hypothetical protein